MVNQAEWMEAQATKVLDMAEMDSLVKENQALWADYDAKKKISSEAYAKAEESDARIMQALKDAGKRTYKVDGVGTITIAQTPAVQTPKTAEEKKAFLDHLKGIGGAELMWNYVSVNSQSLNSWYKQEQDRAEKDGTLLSFQVPGISAPTMRESLRFTQDKKGKK